MFQCCTQFQCSVSWYCYIFCWRIFLPAVKIPMKGKHTLKLVFIYLDWEYVDLSYLFYITWKWMPNKQSAIQSRFLPMLYLFSAYIYNTTILLHVWLRKTDVIVIKIPPRPLCHSAVWRIRGKIGYQTLIMFIIW